MAEKSTFENELPKKSTVKWLRGLDENGNPVLIDISDNATVVGGLIGTATKEKDGLMSKKMATIEIEDWSSDEYIKIETWNGTSCILAITYTRNGASFWTIFGISGPSLSTSSILLSIQDVKFYRDNTGASSLYITKSDRWSGRLYITPLINSDLEAGCSISKISGSLDLSNKTEISALL